MKFTAPGRSHVNCFLNCWTQHNIILPCLKGPIELYIAVYKCIQTRPCTHLFTVFQRLYEWPLLRLFYLIAGELTWEVKTSIILPKLPSPAFKCICLYVSIRSEYIICPWMHRIRFSLNAIKLNVFKNAQCKW